MCCVWINYFIIQYNTTEWLLSKLYPTKPTWNNTTVDTVLCNNGMATQIPVYLDVTVRSLEDSQRFREMFCLHLQGVMVRSSQPSLTLNLGRWRQRHSSEMLVTDQPTAQHHTSDDWNPSTHNPQNLQSPVLLHLAISQSKKKGLPGVNKMVYSILA